MAEWKKRRSGGATEHCRGGSGSTTGVTEHTRESEWGGAIAFANIGFPAGATTGPNWLKKHRPTLLKQFVGPLKYKDFDVIGLCLCEVGNLGDFLDPEQKREFDDLIQEAFASAQNTEYRSTQILWPPGEEETVTAWRHDQEVKILPTLTKLKRVDP